jgi:iron-sulfur cluster assembly protein
MEFQITPKALNKLKSTANEGGIDLDTVMLRVAVIPGGCSGLTYELGWDTTVTDTDETSEVEGVRVVMDLKSRLYVDGTALDFGDGLQGKGFHFDNPQAIRTCACGESFGV